MLSRPAFSFLLMDMNLHGNEHCIIFVTQKGVGSNPELAAGHMTVACLFILFCFLFVVNLSVTCV